MGDRNVTAAMAEHDLAIGGEQSGHIVFADLATTGDGVLTGLIVADLLRAGSAPLSALAGGMTRLPQVLVNVRLSRRSRPRAIGAVQAAVQRGGGRARRPGPGGGAQLRHRAGRAGDGRSAHRGRGRRPPPAA